MKKVNIAATLTIEKVAGLKLTMGLDLGNRSNWYCVLDQSGQVLLEEKAELGQ